MTMLTCGLLAIPPKLSVSSMGNDDREPIEGTSAQVAGTIWWDFLSQVLTKKKLQIFRSLRM